MAITPTLLTNIIDAFEQLMESLLIFDKQLSTSHLPISLPSQERDVLTQQQALDQVRYYYSNIWHSDDTDGRRTQSCYGLVGANTETLESAVKLNTAKDKLRISVGLLQKSELKTASEQLHRRSQALALVLNNQGLGRIHLKQCYRHIPLLDSTPHNVRFSWYNSGRSIKKLTAECAMQMLLKLDTSQPHIVRQIEKLSPLHKNIKMAQIQTQVPVIRANIAWKTGDNNWRRLAKNCPLPILIPLLDEAPLPEHNVLTSVAPILRSRAQRSDSLIDPEPFLPSLRIHLYRK
ncbi:conserved hypothetical protein [Neptunomonas japonica JAMM 1380]|uniref:DNA replication terminus site-binding protein n=2 Tax=Neptunomonas TaxID=75687 RepID=A0A7R6PA70_9GAMM|nr:conserved hypothetical protein [Neptunomonas japonica JAMM 1380]